MKKRDIIFACVLIGIIVGAFLLLFPTGGALPIPTKVATLQVHGKIDTMGSWVTSWTVDASVSNWHTGIPGFLTLDPYLADFYHTIEPPFLALFAPITFDGVFRLTSWTTGKTINKYFSFTQPAGVIWYTGEGTVTFNAVPAGSYTLKLELKIRGQEEPPAVLGEWQLTLVEGQEGVVTLS